jgi:glycosyltransferase involved in cell wall biosynthesis
METAMRSDPLEPLRVLFLSDYYWPATVYGGPVRCMSSLNEALVDAGAKVTVVTTDACGSERLEVPLGERVSIRGVDVFYFPVSRFSPRGFFYSALAAEACENLIERNDIVIVNSIFGNILRVAVMAGRKYRIPVIVSGHGQLLPWALLQKTLKKRFYFKFFGKRYLRSACAIHCSGKLEAEAARAFGFRGRTFIVPHGLDFEFWGKPPKRGVIRRKLGIPEGAVVALFLGRLHEVKRPMFLLECWSQVRGKSDYLVFCGPDEEGFRKELERQASATGNFERVFFIGAVSREMVFQVISDSDFLVMPSAMESFGMAALEALSVGVPVLTSSNVPMGRWAEEAGAGRTADGDENGFSDGIRRMLEDSDERLRMGFRGRERVRREFDSRVVAKKYLAALSAILREWIAE